MFRRIFGPIEKTGRRSLDQDLSIAAVASLISIIVGIGPTLEIVSKVANLDAKQVLRSRFNDAAMMTKLYASLFAIVVACFQIPLAWPVFVVGTFLLGAAPFLAMATSSKLGILDRKRQDEQTLLKFTRDKERDALLDQLIESEIARRGLAQPTGEQPLVSVPRTHPTQLLVTAVPSDSPCALELVSSTSSPER